MREIQRLYFIIKVILHYGLDALIPKTKSTLLLRLGRKILFWIPSYHSQQIGERLRLVLQELGPIWIKFGQMLSTRHDLVSSVIADQLAILQNNVQPFDGILARTYIERAIGKPLEIYFDDFQLKPLASASIAQVHTAKLKNGKEIIIKVIRPDILPIIKDDIRLMYRLANWISYIFPEDGKRLRPIEIVLEYEKILLDELNLLREAANAIQLRRNFKGSTMLYIPEVYIDYCSKNVMVMERIYGIPINDISALNKQDTNMKLLAERGVKVFFTQVFRDNFFHGDMHPGNIFVSLKCPNYPQYIGVDFGIVGSLNKEDKHYLAENFIAFFKRDYRRVAELHVNSGWVPQNTNIGEFESAIRTVCEPIFEKPLSKISFGHILLNLFHTARRFNIEIQLQLILLQKTLLYVEGVGRQLYPQLDLWKTAKPFIENWIKDQVGLPAIWHILKEKSPYWAIRLPELPEIILQHFKQNDLLQKKLDLLSLEIKTKHLKKNQSYLFFIIGITLLLSSSFLLLQNINSELFIIWLIIFGIISCIIGLIRIF